MNYGKKKLRGRKIASNLTAGETRCPFVQGTADLLYLLQ